MRGDTVVVLNFRVFFLTLKLPQKKDLALHKATEMSFEVTLFPGGLYALPL